MTRNVNMFTAISESLPVIKYHKPQRFVFRNGMMIEEDTEEKKPRISRACLLIGNDTYKYNSLPNLTFTACYREKVGEDEKSITRFRKCKVFYYLEDDEFKIYEPSQKNSGLFQGCIVGKGRFMKPTGGYYTIDDLNIGNTLVLNGREYTLINCDTFTKNFLTEMGFRVKSPQPDVFDPITEDRNEMNTLHSYRKPYRKDYALATFLKNHPKCLRFYGYYGEGKNLFEDRREVTLYYDLSNGKIKLVEERCKKKWIDGRSDTPVLLQPTLVPKIMEPSLPIGEMGDPTLLNLANDIQNVMIGGQYYKIQNPSSGLVDSNPTDGPKKSIDYYTDEDLELGKPLNIFCSIVILHDCDEFTRNYYRATHNKELVPVPRPEKEIYHTHKLVYKHEEFGEPEQTLRTNDPFKPKMNNVDLLKFFKNDRYGYNVKELKFLARAITDDPVEKLRRFTVCWFLEDDTMTIRCLDFDNKNESAMEHVHFKRMKVTKPQCAYENAGWCFYQPADMYIGNVIYVRGKAFELLEADEYTYDYMEKHCDMFPVSNIRFIMASFRKWIRTKCGSLKSCFERKDSERTGSISYEDFRDTIYEEIPEEVKVQYLEHAIKTIARYYAEDQYIGLILEDLASKVQTQLYRKKFYDFEDLKVAFAVHDSEKSGYLDSDRIYYVLRTTSLPVDRDLLKSFIYKFPKKESKVNYSNLVEAIDWVTNPTVYDKAEPHAIQINWERKETEKNLNKIKYNCFMMDALSS